RVVHPAHGDHAHRAARAVHECHGVGEVVLEAVLVDRVGVAAAHLHELVLAAGFARYRSTQLGDPRGERAGGSGVAELVDETHARSSYSIRDSSSAAISSA